MKGTEKQIKWAEDIIARAYDTIDRNIANFKERNEEAGFEFFAKDIKALETIRTQIEAQIAKVENAAEIIDHRSMFEARYIFDLVHRIKSKM